MLTAGDSSMVVHTNKALLLKLIMRTLIARITAIKTCTEREDFRIQTLLLGQFLGQFQSEYLNVSTQVATKSLPVTQFLKRSTPKCNNGPKFPLPYLYELDKIA